MKSTKQKKRMQEILPRIEATQINFTKDLKQFIPQNQWAIIKDFKVVLERAVTRFV
jgi:hypothetical protein